MLTYIASGATDVGLMRSNNEDAYLIRPGIGMFALADGMGGAAAGEVASTIFVETADEVFSLIQPASAEDASALVQEVFKRANQRMMAHVAEQPHHRGMGCTAELLVFCGDLYVLGHVGDSRTYMFREGVLRQLTKDHSLVQQQVDQGLISAKETKGHIMKNILLKVLGTDVELSFDLLSGRVLPNDLFLLCSDGLTDMLDDDAIASLLASRENLDQQVGLLVETAKSAGGKDNVSVVLCRADL